LIDVMALMAEWIVLMLLEAKEKDSQLDAKA
jgi:hypothetical protein